MNKKGFHKNRIKGYYIDSVENRVKDYETGPGRDPDPEDSQGPENPEEDHDLS